MNGSEIQIFGNIGREIDSKYTPTGKFIAEFSVGVSVQGHRVGEKRRDD